MALNEVVKNVYTFANILSQAHHSTVRNWDLPSFNNALKWAKFCTKVEEETRNKQYRGDLDKHIKSLTILLNPVSLLQIDLLMLKHAVPCLCKALCQNQDTPTQILTALKKLGDDYFVQVSFNDIKKSSHNSLRVYKLLGEDITFEEKPILVQARFIMERLSRLQNTCTYSEQRFNRFLEKTFNELQKIDTGWELMVHMLLAFTDTEINIPDKLLQQCVQLILQAASDVNCGLWRCSSELLCTLCGYEDNICDMYINHIWALADRMEPEYGQDENGNLYTWRHRKGTEHHLQYIDLVDILRRLSVTNPRCANKLKTELMSRSETSYFNIYKDILKKLGDLFNK